MGRCFITAFHGALGEKFTVEMKDAWLNAYPFLASTMTRAMGKEIKQELIRNLIDPDHFSVPVFQFLLTNKTARKAFSKMENVKYSKTVEYDQTLSSPSSSSITTTSSGISNMSYYSQSSLSSSVCYEGSRSVVTKSTSLSNPELPFLYSSKNLTKSQFLNHCERTKTL
eukprot:Pgem_evm1s6733